MNKAKEFTEYLDSLNEADSKKIREVLILILNLLKVRGISLNKKEQEKVSFSISKILK